MKEKKLEKGFAFGYGSENFGYELDLSKELEFNTKINEGYGIAFIAGKHINFEKAKRIKFEIKNISNEDIIIRIEKKFYNDIKTGFESVDSDSSKKVSLELTRKDTEEYDIDFFAIDASEVANHVKNFPLEWILDNYRGVTQEALDYLVFLTFYNLHGMALNILVLLI